MNNRKPKRNNKKAVFYTPKPIQEFIMNGTVVYDCVIGNPPLTLTTSDKRKRK